MGRRTLLRGGRGSATVEFFLVLPVVVIVLVVSIQLIGISRFRLEMLSAAREGVRVAATTPDPSRAVDAVMAALPVQMRSVARISVQRPSTVGVPARVTVSARYRMGVPFPPDIGVDLTVSVSMRTER